jgi:anti-anti-sigma factor
LSARQSAWRPSENSTSQRPRLRARLDELRGVPPHTVVLDLRGLTFLNSSGVHLTVSWDHHARENGIDYEIIHGPAAVRRTFEITGLLQHLPFQVMGTENGTSAPSTGSLRQQNGHPTG